MSDKVTLYLNGGHILEEVKLHDRDATYEAYERDDQLFIVRPQDIVCFSGSKELFNCVAERNAQFLKNGQSVPGSE